MVVARRRRKAALVPSLAARSGFGPGRGSGGGASDKEAGCFYTLQKRASHRRVGRISFNLFYAENPYHL